MIRILASHRAARLRVLLAVAAVLAIKLTVLMQVGGHPLLHPGGELDGAYYVHLASGVRDGDWSLLSPENFMRRPVPPFFLPPLYVYFLAVSLKLTGGAFEAARFAQVLLGTVGVLLLALTARRWYGASAGWWTGALAALCGLFTFYEVTMLQAALEPFLTALDLWLLTRAVQDGRRAWWAAAGAALGLHALNRPNVLFVLAGIGIVVLALALLRRRTVDASTRPGLPDLAALAVAALIVISPATIRNWRATGEFVPISSHAGLNFLIGNNAEADGTFRAVMGVEPSVSGQWIGARKWVTRCRRQRRRDSSSTARLRGSVAILVLPSRSSRANSNTRSAHRS
jgi:4-amino-4-deoxy-L-arabinose transferase-like glycosyltransferase